MEPIEHYTALLTIICVQESCDPSYVALLAAHTTHRAVLAGDTTKAPALCDHTSDFVEEAVRYIIYLSSAAMILIVQKIFLVGRKRTFKSPCDLSSEFSPTAAGCRDT